MKTKEVIASVQSIIDCFEICRVHKKDTYIPIDAEDVEALRTAVEALKQEPCEDCIRRSDIGLTDFEIVMCNGDYKEALKMLLDKIEKAPSVTPAEKMGHWFVDERPESNREIICSNCEQPVFKFHKLDFDYRPNYCPNCGAKMREVKDEID